MLLSLSGNELLPAVDVIGCAREGGVGHDVYSERGHVGRPDDASDGKRGAKLKSKRIRGVESRGTQGVNLTGSVLEAVGIPPREDHLGPFCAWTTCRFEPDASAIADHNNGLPKEPRFSVDGRGDGYGAHRSSDSTSILRATLPAIRKLRSALRVMFNTLCEI